MTNFRTQIEEELINNLALIYKKAPRILEDLIRVGYVRKTRLGTFTPEERNELKLLLGKYPFKEKKEVYMVNLPSTNIKYMGKTKRVFKIRNFLILYVGMDNFLSLLYHCLERGDVIVFGDLQNYESLIPIMGAAFPKRSLINISSEIKVIELDWKVDNFSIHSIARRVTHGNHPIRIRFTLRKGSQMETGDCALVLHWRDKWWRIDCLTCYKAEEGVYSIGCNEKSLCPHLSVFRKEILGYFIKIGYNFLTNWLGEHPELESHQGAESESISVHSESVHEESTSVHDDLLGEEVVEEVLDLSLLNPLQVVYHDGKYIVRTGLKHLGDGVVDLERHFCLTDKSYSCPHVYLVKQKVIGDKWNS
ncbi:MAG: hypothetical protein QXH51_06155 [Candidatus Bathyarchaeia archaeon]